MSVGNSFIHNLFKQEIFHKNTLVQIFVLKTSKPPSPKISGNIGPILEQSNTSMIMNSNFSMFRACQSSALASQSQCIAIQPISLLYVICLVFYGRTIKNLCVSYHSVEFISGQWLCHCGLQFSVTWIQMWPYDQFLLTECHQTDLSGFQARETKVSKVFHLETEVSQFLKG